MYRVKMKMFVSLHKIINSDDNIRVKLQHTTLVGGPNPTCCPLCQKVCLSGEALMEHMKFVHKDPNASGVPGNPTNFVPKIALKK